jgi:ATP-dependent HslUV protease ATP-binding subunit HslU
MEEINTQVQSMMDTITSKKSSKYRMTIKNALKKIQEEEAGKLINEKKSKHCLSTMPNKMASYF